MDKGVESGKSMGLGATAEDTPGNIRGPGGWGGRPCNRVGSYVGERGLKVIFKAVGPCQL